MHKFRNLRLVLHRHALSSSECSSELLALGESQMDGFMASLPTLDAAWEAGKTLKDAYGVRVRSLPRSDGKALSFRMDSTFELPAGRSRSAKFGAY